MEPFKEGEWAVLHHLNKKKLARIGRKGFTTLGKDFVSLEGAIGCLPWTNFKMERDSGPKSGKRMFKIVPTEEEEDDDDGDLNHSQGDIDGEDRDNRDINDDGQSQGLSSVEIEELREGGLTGKEIVNHLVANSSTFDKKTCYAKSKYLKKKEKKHCLREKVCIRRTTLSSVAEVLCSGGSGEGSRGSISGMRPDTLSQMLTALNIQWKRIPSVKQTPSKQSTLHGKNRGKTAVCVHKMPAEDSQNSDCGSGVVKTTEHEDSPSDTLENENISKVCVRETVTSSEDKNYQSGTTYVVYESGNWGLLVAALLTLLPADGPRLIHLHPGDGFPCLIAPRALNLPLEKFSMLYTVKFKPLLEKLGKLGSDTNEAEVKLKEEDNNESAVVVEEVLDAINEGSGDILEENKVQSPENEKNDDNPDEQNGTINENRKRKLEPGEESQETESLAKKPRWQLAVEMAADLLTTSKADGLIVVASREHPVSIVLSLLSYLAPSRPLVVYCPHREPLIHLYAVLKGWEPWATRYGKCMGKDGVPRVANLRVTENWLRSYQVLPNRTHPEVNMTPGGGFILTGTVIDFSDE